MKNDLILKKYGINLVKIVIAFVAVYFIYIEGKSQLNKYNYNDVMNLLASLNIYTFAILMISGVITFSCMTIYDLLLLRHIKYNLNFLKIIKISWIANSFNNFLSFAGLTGASLRTFLYKKQNVSTKEAVYASAMMAPSTVIGISVSSWLIILNVIKIRPMLLKYSFLWLGVVGFAVYLIVYMLLYEWDWLNQKIISKVQGSVSSTKDLRWKLVGASLTEWFLIGIFFSQVCRVFTTGISFVEAMGILILSAIAGIVSFVPGGMGSFDLVCLLGLQTMGADSGSAMAIVIIFRVFYYIIPWLLGVILCISEIFYSIENYKLN